MMEDDDVSKQLDEQLAEITLLIDELDTVSERLKRAADKAIELINTRKAKNGGGGADDRQSRD